MDGAGDAEYLALLEEEDRRASRRDFLRFYCRMTGFLPPPHVRKVAQFLQAIEEDRIQRGMLFLPPRHAKTLLATTLFPAWVMGRHPQTPMMTVTHTERFSKKVGGRVRNLLKQPAWPFPEVRLSEDSTAKEAWTTTQGGEYNAFGMFGGNQHGSPASFLFMDDIIKGRKIAMSDHMREEAWETYTSDLVSRLQGRAKQLIVFTRWHEDDPAGRILPASYDGRTGWYRDRTTGEPWFVLSMPAIAEHENDPIGRKPGEWLWPEEFGEKKLGGLRKRGGWVWSALFQQRPSPEEGLLFSTEHIQRYRRSSIDATRLAVYISSDYAVTAEAGAPDPDWTVHQVWGVDEEYNAFLLDMWRGRKDSAEWVRHWIRLVKRYKPVRAFEEGGQILKSVGPFLETMAHEEQAFVSRVQLNSTTNKEARAQALLGMASMGKVYLPHKDEVGPDLLTALEAFEKELLQFPAGRHDDTVDAATLFARGLNRMIRGRKRHQPTTSADGTETLDSLFSRHESQNTDDDW